MSWESVVRLCRVLPIKLHLRRVLLYFSLLLFSVWEIIFPSKLKPPKVFICLNTRKVELVQTALEKEVERHRCAVKLLPYFFTKEELKNSNTDGTHGKLCLDQNKLNSLKVLVFTKFPAESTQDKDKIWRFIKTKINARCRASKFAGRDE